MAGGIRDDNKLKAFIPGGSSANILTADKVDVPYDYEAIAEAGSMLGSGALIVMDHTVNIVEAALRMTYFYMHESCGKCTPCREGTRWMYQILSDIQDGKGSNKQIEKLEDICDNMSFKCFCALGDAAVAPVASSIMHFRSDYDELIKKMEGDAVIA